MTSVSDQSVEPSGEPASHDRSDWREMLTHGPESPAVRERAGQRPLRPVARLSRRRTSSA